MVSYDLFLSTSYYPMGHFVMNVANFLRSQIWAKDCKPCIFFFFFNSVGLQINIKVIYIENNFKMHFNTFISYFQYLLQKMIPIHDLK